MAGKPGPGKGNTNNPNGRPKGIGNKDLQPIREAFTKLVEDNLENMNRWLREVAEESPEKALHIVQGLAEFSIPKLQRTELKHDVSEGTKFTLSFDTVQPPLLNGVPKEDN